MKKFPFDIYRQLTATDFRVLELLAFLSRQQAKRSPIGARYCCPGRRKIAALLGICIRTVSRSTARLRRLGILDVNHRRRVRGVWRTNLYKLRHWGAWRFAQIGALPRALKPKHHGTPVAHLASPMVKTITSPAPLPPKITPIRAPAAHAPPQEKSGRQILAEWLTRGTVN